MKANELEKDDIDFIESLFLLTRKPILYVANVDEKEIILDIGPNTIKNIERTIDQSNTVLWNGPAGYFENKNFSIGTLAISPSIYKKLNFFSSTSAQPHKAR